MNELPSMTTRLTTDLQALVPVRGVARSKHFCIDLGVTPPGHLPDTTA